MDGADLARVDSNNGVSFFDNMFDRPVTAKSWKSVEISGIVDPVAPGLSSVY